MKRGMHLLVVAGFVLLGGFPPQGNAQEGTWQRVLDTSDPATLYVSGNALGTNTGNVVTQNAEASRPTVSGGIYQSRDAGRHWRQLDTGLDPLRCQVSMLAVAPSASQTIYGAGSCFA